MSKNTYVFFYISVVIGVAVFGGYSKVRSRVEPTMMPADLMSQGRPIDPVCIYEVLYGDGPCGQPHDMRALMKRRELINEQMGGPFTWKYLGTLPGTNQHLLEYEYLYLRGTGRHSGIILLECNNGMIACVSQLFSGDRALRALVSSLALPADEDATPSPSPLYCDGILTVWQWVTPADIFDECLAALAAKQSIPCDGLECSPQSYAGKLCTRWCNGHYDVVGVLLCAKRIDQLYTDTPSQEIFKRVAQRYICSGKRFLDKQQMAQFAQDIVKLCADYHAR